MKTALILLTLNFYLVPVLFTKPNTPLIKYHRKRSPNSDQLEHNFLQKLDHFDPVDHQKWRQRYWNHSSMYKVGGPAFLFVSGEWTASPNFTIGYGDYWLSYAEELNAYCFSLEHRFYGKSWPRNGNMIRHLNSEQAIADIAYFIQNAPRKFNLPRDIKWIVFGCSYAGSLAAWARLKYPHLVLGAVASSAPLLAKANYSEYQEVVEKSLNFYHPQCVENIALAIQELVNLSVSENGTKKILKAFGLNDKNKDTDILEEAFGKIQNVLQNAAQHDNNVYTDIAKVCNQMLIATGKKNKHKYLADLIKFSEEMDGIDDGEDINAETWLYQSCSEFGFFQSISETSSLFAGNFSPSAEKQIKEDCKRFFGPGFSFYDVNERVLQTNALYGGLDFNVDRTVFVHGSNDPWHVLGLHEKKKDSLYQTVFINASSHCSETYYPTQYPEIPSELADARQEILKILKDWLK